MTDNELQGMRQRIEAARPQLAIAWTWYERDLARLLDDVDCLRAALLAVELNDKHCCIWCGRNADYGHFPNCQRQIALGIV